MPKRGTQLTATAVRNLSSPGKYYDINGLFLRIEPTGSRRWVQRVSVGGRQREIGLGSADLVTLAEAREITLKQEASKVRWRSSSREKESSNYSNLAGCY